MMRVWERLISCGTKASCKIPNVRFIHCPTFVVKKKSLIGLNFTRLASTFDVNFMQTENV